MLHGCCLTAGTPLAADLLHISPFRFYLAYKETPESRDSITDLTLISRHYLR